MKNRHSSKSEPSSNDDTFKSLDSFSCHKTRRIVSFPIQAKDTTLAPAWSPTCNSTCGNNSIANGSSVERHKGVSVPSSLCKYLWISFICLSQHFVCLNVWVQIFFVYSYTLTFVIFYVLLCLLTLFVFKSVDTPYFQVIVYFIFWHNLPLLVFHIYFIIWCTLSYDLISI